MEEFTFEKLLVRWYNFYASNFWTIAILTILGGVLATVHVNLKEKVYQSDCMIYSNLIGKERLSVILEDVSTLIKKGEHKKLMSLLSLSEKEAKTIRAFEIENLDVSSSDASSEFNDFDDNCLLLEVQTYEPEIIAKFQKGLISSITKNEFLMRLAEMREKSLKRIIVKLNEQIRSLEEFQKSSIASMANRNDGVIISNDKNSSSVDLIELTEKKAAYQEKLSLGPVAVIKPFYEPEKPEGMLTIYVSVGLIVGFLAGVIISVLRKLRRSY